MFGLTVVVPAHSPLAHVFGTHVLLAAVVLRLRAASAGVEVWAPQVLVVVLFLLGHGGVFLIPQPRVDWGDPPQEA